MKTDRERIEEDIEAVNLGNLNTVEFDLTLPAYGANGSRITWTSSDTRFLKRNGKVIQPKNGTGKRMVTLTGKFQYHDVVDEKEYSVTILEQSQKIEASYIYPIHVRAQLNKRTALPSCAIMITTQGETLSHTVNWMGNEEVCYPACGTYSLKGVLLDNTAEVTAVIEVVEEVSKKLSAQRKQVTPIQGDVRLLDSDFRDAQNRRLAYLLVQDDDQMLYNFRTACGLDTKGAPAMSGWDHPDSKLRGHTTGHYLSALAVCYQSVPHPLILHKARYMVQELGLCQQAFEKLEGFQEGYLGGFDETAYDRLERFSRYPEIWAPYYTMHKYFAGLLDCYELLHIEEALLIARKLGDWVYRRLSRLSKPQLKTMWGIYIAGEYGGMNEVLARLYLHTRDPHHVKAAQMFDNDRLFVPMQSNVDALCGLHVNQHIPQVLGALKIFEGNHVQAYFDIAKNFWHMVIKDHSYANGGIGEGEIFHAPGSIAAMIDDNTAETCASYNMLKLSAELFAYDPDVAYMDYYERCMINHILASEYQAMEGASTYFLPMEPGSCKSALDENSCCHGTGMENHFRYPRAIYFHSDEILYINLFVASTMHWGNLQVTMDLDMCEPQNIHLLIQGEAACEIRIRIPYWTDEVSLLCDGTSLAYTEKQGYICIHKQQEAMRMQLRFSIYSRLEFTPDDPLVATVFYGPYLLAALQEGQDYLSTTLSCDTVRQRLQPIPGTLLFFDEVDQLMYRPLYQLQKEQYHTYIHVKQ